LNGSFYSKSTDKNIVKKQSINVKNLKI